MVIYKCADMTNPTNKVSLPRDEVISTYKETYSVSKVLAHFGYPRGNSDKRADINNILKEEGIFEGNSGPNVIRLRDERKKKTMLERYGVENYSYTLMGKGNTHNQREMKQLPFVEEFRVYQRECENLTKKYKRTIKNPPTHCEYIGIEFIDDTIANPNDPTKRTIDHKKSLYVCWLEGVSPQEACDPSNLAWVCRYANSVKGNANYEDIQHTLDLIKARL